jgi:serralysin
MYGANYTTNSGSTVYSWSATTGEMFVNGVGMGAPAGNKIFMTIWDGGGNDTYDFSNYTTNLKVDLNPGGWTTASTTQLASLGSGHYAAGNIANALLYKGNTASLIENAVGGSGSDNLIGNVADNKFTGGRGNDVMDGGAGNDTAIYSGVMSAYSWSQDADGSWTITDLRTGSPDGTDTLRNLEFLQFADSSVAIGSYTPPPVNTAPSFRSSAPSVSLTEWADLSSDESLNTAHIATGTMTFADPDAGNSHTATITPEGSGYLGSFEVRLVGYHLERKR